MKGTVEPPSRSSTAAFTCRSRTPSSSAILLSMDPTSGVVTIPYRLLTEVARQLWQVTPTIGDQGAVGPVATDERGSDQTLRLGWRTRPRRRAGPGPGSVTTVAIAPPIWRRTSAMARNTCSPFGFPAASAGRPTGTSVAASHACPYTPSEPARVVSAWRADPPGRRPRRAPCARRPSRVPSGAPRPLLPGARRGPRPGGPSRVRSPPAGPCPPRSVRRSRRSARAHAAGRRPRPIPAGSSPRVPKTHLGASPLPVAVCVTSASRPSRPAVMSAAR
ncbi:hypothetical protein STENM36S_00052 [Streptomyces tendae]